MASESTRHIKGLSDTIWADFTVWPGFDEASLAPDKLAKFLNRKEAIKAYLSGSKVATIRKEYGISEPQIYRLITERCICNHPDGQIYGWRALIPRTRIVQFKRRSPIVINQWGHGAVGAFQTLLDTYPDVREALHKKILKVPNTRKKLGMLSTSKRSIWLWFLQSLREKGLEIKGEWPFNTKTNGYHTIIKYIDKVLHENPGKAILIHGGNELQRKMQAGDGVDRPVHRPFQRVEMDAHKIDGRFTVAIPLLEGGYQNVLIHRIWVIVIIEVVTRLVLGYHMSLRKEISKEDVLRVIKKSLSPWAKKKLHHTDKDFYIDGAGFPCVLGEQFTGICWDETSIDGALAEKAKVVTEVLKNSVGSILLTPENSYAIRRTKDDRPFIESFFNKLGILGFQKISNTTGNYPGATKGRDPIGVAVASEFQYEYAEELLDIIIANYNARIHSRLSGRSPLQYLQYLVLSKTFQPRVIDPQHLNTFFSYRKLCMVKGGLDAGKRPYVNFENGVYTSPILGQRHDLAGKKIWITADSDSDSRVIKASSLTGEHIDNLRVSPPWNRVPHNFETRRLICGLIRQGKFSLQNQQDAVESYIAEIESSGGKFPPHPAYLTARNFLVQSNDTIHQTTDNEPTKSDIASNVTNKSAESRITYSTEDKSKSRSTAKNNTSSKNKQKTATGTSEAAAQTQKSASLPPRRKAENK